MLKQHEENANDLPRLHSRNGYTPLAVVPAVLNGAGDYPPDEEPELCAICEKEITAGQPFRKYDERPGYYNAHSECFWRV